MAKEPRVTINSQPLSAAQALTVRVALTSMLIDLSARPDALGTDAHGQAMRAMYIQHLRSLLRMCGVDTGKDAGG